MDSPSERKFIDISFEISLILKAINAVVEIVAGIVTIFITHSFVLHLANFLTHDELIEDPSNSFAHYVLRTADHFSVAGKIFIVWYLLSHGIIKLILVVGLFKKQVWAYPLSLFVFTIFIVYQLHRYIYTHSIWLIVLTVFDLFLMWLVWKEYQYVKISIEKPLL